MVRRCIPILLWLASHALVPRFYRISLHSPLSYWRPTTLVHKFLFLVTIPSAILRLIVLSTSTVTVFSSKPFN